eukprot:TRINITY_DN449_c0_g1_i1.p1 TRINITY_DN449_c0_g1~~TRINITY_DN449_c0_g1_i1.p1  ORF type:complete len:413 (+),score=33.56 TRINITY_DN449_c0_g1_i1:320-1558(+)
MLGVWCHKLQRPLHQLHKAQTSTGALYLGFNTSLGANLSTPDCSFASTFLPLALRLPICASGMEALDNELQRIFSIVRTSKGRPDPFGVLGVPRVLSPDTELDIRQQYRRLSLLLHPDRNVGSVVSQAAAALAPIAQGSNLFEEAFKYVAEAYNELSDPVRRLELLRNGSQMPQKPRKKRQYRSTDTEEYHMYSQLCDSLLKNFGKPPAAQQPLPSTQIPWDLIQRLKSSSASNPAADPSSPLIPPPPIVAAAFAKVSTTHSTTTTTTTNTTTTTTAPVPVSAAKRRKKNSSQPQAGGSAKRSPQATQVTTKTTTTTTTTTSTKVTSYAAPSFLSGTPPPSVNPNLYGSSIQFPSAPSGMRRPIPGDEGSALPNPKRVKLETPASNSDLPSDDFEAARLFKEFLSGLGDLKQ